MGSGALCSIPPYHTVRLGFVASYVCVTTRQASSVPFFLIFLTIIMDITMQVLPMER